MKIDIKKKIQKDTFYSLVPINWLLRCTGLSNIYRKRIQLEESGSITKTFIYIISFAIINIVCLLYKIKTFKGEPLLGSVKFADSIQLTYWLSYSEYVVDMYFVYKCSKHSYLKYFKAFDRLDGILGIPSYDDIRKTVIQSIILAFAISFPILIFDFITWVRVEGWKATTVYAVEYVYLIMNMLTVLDIISHVIQVEYRLRRILVLLQDYTITKKRGVDNNIHCFFGKDNGIKTLSILEPQNFTSRLETGSFGRCYLQLLGQVSYVNTSYGYRVLLYCTNLLINVINLLNLAIRLINGTLVYDNGTSNQANLMASASSLLRALNYAAIVTILMYRCEVTYKQNEMILETVDELLISKKNDIDMRTNLLEFRNLLITRPINFHAAKFFSMDYTLLVSLCSVIITYTVIMLQSLQ